MILSNDELLLCGIPGLVSFLFLWIDEIWLLQEILFLDEWWTRLLKRGNEKDKKDEKNKRQASFCCCCFLQTTTALLLLRWVGPYTNPLCIEDECDSHLCSALLSLSSFGLLLLLLLFMYVSFAIYNFKLDWLVSSPPPSDVCVFESGHLNTPFCLFVCLFGVAFIYLFIPERERERNNNLTKRQYGVHTEMMV